MLIEQRPWIPATRRVRCADVRRTRAMTPGGVGGAIVAHAALPRHRRAEHRMAMRAPQHPPPDTRRRWTAREVRALVAANPLVTPRYELVDGELLVTPSPSHIH